MTFSYLLRDAENNTVGNPQGYDNCHKAMEAAEDHTSAIAIWAIFTAEEKEGQRSQTVPLSRRVMKRSSTSTPCIPWTIGDPISMAHSLAVEVHEVLMMHSSNYSGEVANVLAYLYPAILKGTTVELYKPEHATAPADEDETYTNAFKLLCHCFPEKHPIWLCISEV